MSELTNYSVTVVTVTYGDRRALLRQVLNRLVRLGIAHVVVIDNGATWSVKAELGAIYHDFIDVVEMGKNTGSAKGYATGIQRALDLNAEYIWLLDDDNRPRSNTLQELCKAYSKWRGDITYDRLAVLAFRPEHQADIAMRVPIHRISVRSNSFLGFHLLDIPYKMWRRTAWGRPRVSGGLPAMIAMEKAPYSGLLFHRDLIQSIGLPNIDYVLYVDDTDFTYRITKKGGQTLLVTAALLDELESSWSVKSKFGNSFLGLLRGEGDFRAYYAMRNETYFDIRNFKKNAFFFWLNKTVYMGVLLIFSIVLKEQKRYRLLRNAMKDGFAGKLGVNPMFPL